MRDRRDRVIKKPKALPRICADERGSEAKVFTAKDAKERKESGDREKQNHRVFAKLKSKTFLPLG